MWQFDRQAYEKRMQWFQEARFGMFLHWGLYSIPGRGEWIRSTEQMPESEYIKYFEEFNPTDYDPKKWARMAKEAGMKYMVMTAKHHDGFCLFDSQYTDFKATNTKAGRDLIREYVDAARAEGLKVGLYYSLLDWHHPDFPQYQDRNAPMRNHPECGNEHRDFSRYITYFHNQVRELCTKILWLDHGKQICFTDDVQHTCDAYEEFLARGKKAKVPRKQEQIDAYAEAYQKRLADQEAKKEKEKETGMYQTV